MNKKKSLVSCLIPIMVTMCVFLVACSKNEVYLEYYSSIKIDSSKFHDLPDYRIVHKIKDFENHPFFTPYLDSVKSIKYDFSKYQYVFTIGKKIKYLEVTNDECGEFAYGTPVIPLYYKKNDLKLYIYRLPASPVYRIVCG